MKEDMENHLDTLFICEYRCLCECLHIQKKKASHSEAGIIGCCELPDMSAEN